LAALEALWTDNLELLPANNDSIWWEVWLRRSSKIDFEAFLHDHANQLQMKVSKEAIRFLDRTVILVYGTKQQMSRSINLLGSIAEVRKVKDSGTNTVAIIFLSISLTVHNSIPLFWASRL
jgi:hypothetical protein